MGWCPTAVLTLTPRPPYRRPKTLRRAQSGAQPYNNHTPHHFVSAHLWHCTHANNAGTRSAPALLRCLPSELVLVHPSCSPSRPLLSLRPSLVITPFALPYVEPSSGLRIRTPQGMQYNQRELNVDLSRHLTASLQQRYLCNGAFYTLCQTSPVTDPQRRLTEDLRQFCDAISDLFPSLLKPLVELMFCLVSVSRYASQGLHGLRKPC